MPDDPEAYDWGWLGPIDTKLKAELKMVLRRRLDELMKDDLSDDE